MKHPKPCIFCGIRNATSKEHFWPQWLAPFLISPEANAHITEFRSAEGKQPQRLERHSERPGAVHTKKIRAVCAACNNGWMSTLEFAVKQVLVPLLTSTEMTLSGTSLETLALWVTVKSIVGEHATQSTALTTPHDRRTLYESNVIPCYFRIFVALHTLQTQTAYYRNSTTVSTHRTGPVPALPDTIFRNIQATTFLVGPLCFYVTSSRVEGLSNAVLDPATPMHRLWPDHAQHIDLSVTPPLAESEVYSVSRSLERFVEHPRVKYGGPLPRCNASETLLPL